MSPNAAAAARIASLATAWVGAGQLLVNQFRVSGSTQVNLRVRVAEVSRNVSRSLGFNWSGVFQVGSFALGLETGPLAGVALAGTGRNVFSGAVATRRASATATLDAMATEGLVTMLAKPNLTATSGATATFLAGGNIPIPVPQALGVSAVQYQQIRGGRPSGAKTHGSDLYAMSWAKLERPANQREAPCQQARRNDDLHVLHAISSPRVRPLSLLRAIQRLKNLYYVQCRLHAMLARSKQAVQIAVRMASALFARNRQDLNRVLVSYRTFSQRWTF